MANPVLGHSLVKTILRVCFTPPLRKPGLRCFRTIMKNFFFLQYKADASPGLIPVSRVDHPLDEKIPFKPSWVKTYLHFIEFWIQVIGFLLKRYGKAGIAPAKDFINTLSDLYIFTAQVYSKHMSTTDRPKYYKNLRFIAIHLTDPHLMCIPSLHVMIVIRTYTKFRDIVRSLGDEEILAKELNDIYQGALKITEAVLYVKQHSVNCIPAAMYAMSRFEPPLFQPDEAKQFAEKLFIHESEPCQDDVNAIRMHILSLYDRFMNEGTQSVHWEDPLILFLRSSPQKD